MNLQPLLAEFDSRTSGPLWYPVAGYVDEIYSELGAASNTAEDRSKLLDAQHLLQERCFGEASRTLFPRLIASELLALVAIDPGDLHNAISRFMERNGFSEDDQAVAMSLAAHLMLDPRSDSIIDTPYEGDSFFRARGMDMLPWKLDLGIEIKARLSKRYKPTAAPLAPQMGSIRTLTGLLPGDCIFRRQTRPWTGNPFRDFGHVGLYIGCTDSALDPTKCSNHAVVHVVSATPACLLQTLQDFCNPHGKPETFWGAYEADLTNSERQTLITTAYGLVGSCTYSFTHGYKNIGGKSFRCDGFVEYCYESAKPAASPLSYRGGLYEDDSWKRMHPHGLRNSLVRKVATDIWPCCDSGFRSA